MKKIGDLTVNDGKGLLDNEGLCDYIASNLNNAVRSLVNGNTLQFCQKVSEITTQLAHLKKGIKDDIDSKDRIIDELKKINDELANQTIKDGV